MTKDIICVERIRDRFVVWMVPALDPEARPCKCDAKFYQEADALTFALAWADAADAGGVAMMEGVDV